VRPQFLQELPIAVVVAAVADINMTINGHSLSTRNEDRYMKKKRLTNSPLQVES
jgi:hypothetical protein